MPAISSHGVGLPFASVHSPVAGAAVLAVLAVLELALLRLRYQNQARAPMKTAAPISHCERVSPRVFLPPLELEPGGSAVAPVASLTRR